MFNDVDVVIDRICAIGPVKSPNADFYDYFFEIWFASMSMKPNPMAFGVCFQDFMVDGIQTFKTPEEAKSKLEEYRNELIGLVKSL